MTKSLEPTPRLPAKNLAVLVIDVQAGLFSTNPPPFEAAEVIRRINAVTAKARAANVPVIFIRHQGPPDPPWQVPEGSRLDPSLQIVEGEVIIDKTTADAFCGTDLEKVLSSLGIRSLVLMGYATDFCVDATLRNAASRGFEIFVVCDAHTTNDGPELKASAIREHFNWAWADSFSTRGIHLVTAAQVRFAAPIESPTPLSARKRRLHQEPPEPN